MQQTKTVTGLVVDETGEPVIGASVVAVSYTHLDVYKRQQFAVRNPKLWSPDSPYLYRIQSRVKAGHEGLDGGVTRVGIRKAEFKGKDGFWLNGKPFGQLVGAHRHQDFAYVGNALPKMCIRDRPIAIQMAPSGRITVSKKCAPASSPRQAR